MRLFLESIGKVLFVSLFLLTPGCTDQSPEVQAKNHAQQEQAHMTAPTSLVINRQGNIYVSEKHTGRIYCVQQDGTTILFAQGLNSPTGLCLDRDGNLLVAETGTSRILRISPNGAQSVLGRQ